MSAVGSQYSLSPIYPPVRLVKQTQAIVPFARSVAKSHTNRYPLLRVLHSVSFNVPVHGLVPEYTLPACPTAPSPFAYIKFEFSSFLLLKRSTPPMALVDIGKVLSRIVFILVLHDTNSTGRFKSFCTALVTILFSSTTCSNSPVSALNNSIFVCPLIFISFSLQIIHSISKSPIKALNISIISTFFNIS